MAIKVKAVERQLKVGKDAGKYRRQRSTTLLPLPFHSTLSCRPSVSAWRHLINAPKGASG